MLGIDPKAARYTWSAALVLLLLGSLYLIREALFIFVIALLFAYLLYPLMDLIDRHMTTKTRTPALAMTFILVLGIIVAVGVSAGSAVATEATGLASEAPAFLERMRQNPQPGPAPNEVKSLESQIIGMAAGQLQQHYGDLAKVVPEIVLHVLSASQNLIYLVIVPILSFLILRDGRNIRDSFLEVFDSGKEAARETLADVHELLLLYMRALLFLCCTTVITYSIALSVMGVPYALLLASIAFPLEFIPFVGPLVSASIIVIVSIVSGYAHVWWLLVFLGVYRVFEDYVLSPHLMSRGIELHPLLVIFGVLAGGEIGGVAGVFLSIPSIALIRLLYHHLNKARTRRRVRSIA